MKCFSAIPVLRIFDRRKALEHYVEWLGFTVQGCDNLEGDGPCYLEIRRDEAVLQLSEHYGDGSPGAKVWVPVDDATAFHEQLNQRPNVYMRPGLEDQPWGAKTVTVWDPFGNRVVFSENRVG